MAGKKRPDDEVSAFALYYREYRRKKKAGEYIPPRGRPEEVDDNKLSTKPHSVYTRNWRRKRSAELKELKKQIEELKNKEVNNDTNDN